MTKPSNSNGTGPSCEVVTPMFGYHLLADPLLNKGTAFTDDERHEFELHGLLPPTIATLDQQVSRRLAALRGFGSDLERYAFLRDLQDTNETLFHTLLSQEHRGVAADRLHADGGCRLPEVSAGCSGGRAGCSSVCRTASG